MTIEKTDPKNFLWVEAYRPKKVADCILPDNLKKIFQEFVDKQEIPNLLISGKPGTGKTTVARAMCEELDIDFIEINGSLNGNIDTLRVEIQNFASTVSIVSSGRKMVILDEADGLNPNSVQPALRNFIESYSKNCGFILTCNYKNKIIEPLRDSRLSNIDFNIAKKDIAALGPKFLKRVEAILKNEGVEYDQKAVAAVISKFFPDCRRVLTELQTYAASGKIDSGILVDFTQESFKSLVGYMKNHEFTKVRKWIGENEDISSAEFFRRFYDSAYDILNVDSVPQLILFLADYQDKESRVADTQINRAGFAVSVMADCVFKE